MANPRAKQVKTLTTDFSRNLSAADVDVQTALETIDQFDFALSGHNHDDLYYRESEVDTLLSGKAAAMHTHDDRYYTESEIDTLLSGKSAVGHNHDLVYSPLVHTHDDRYYTESEVDTLLSGKSDIGHNHDTTYLALDGSNSDDTTNDFEFFKNLTVGNTSDGKHFKIYRKANEGTNNITFMIDQYQGAQLVTDALNMIIESYAGDLGLQYNAFGNVHLFASGTVSDTANGKSFTIYRKAAEATDTLKMLIDQNRVASFTTTATTTEYRTTYTGRGLFELTHLDFYISPYDNENKVFRHYGYITGATAQKYIQWQVEDTADTYTLSRQDTNISALRVQMPMLLTDDASGDIECFKNGTIDNAADGKSLYIYRKAAEGTDYIRQYISQYQVPTILFSGVGGVRILENSNRDIVFQDGGGAVVLGASYIGSGINPTFQHWGYITAAAAAKYVSWKIEDVADTFTLSRQDSNITSFRIQMPMLLTDDASGDIECFKNGSIANNANGKSFYIYRNAPEANTYIRFYIDDGATPFMESNRDFVIKPNFASGFSTESYGPLAIGDLYAGANWTFRHWGKLTGIGQKYVQFQLNDATDIYELTRQDSNILGFDIQMPLKVTLSNGIDGINLTGTNPSIHINDTVRDLDLGIASGDAAYSQVSLQGDAVLRANDLNLLLSANNASGGIKLVTGSPNTVKWYVNSAGNLLAGIDGTGAFNILTTGTLGAGAITGTSLIKSGGTSSQFLKADGSVDSSTYVTTTTVAKRSITIPASAWLASATDGADYVSRETSSYKHNTLSLDFDPTTKKYAEYGWILPLNYDGSTITVRFGWKHGATSTNFGVRWGLQAVAFADGDPLDVAWGTAQEVTDTGGVTNKTYMSPSTPAITIAGTPAAGNRVRFRIYRDPVNAADNLAVMAQLDEVEITYGINKWSEE